MRAAVLSTDSRASKLNPLTFHQLCLCNEKRLYLYLGIKVEIDVVNIRSRPFFDSGVKQQGLTEHKVHAFLVLQLEFDRRTSQKYPIYRISL